jgi:hypothetical protein
MGKLLADFGESKGAEVRSLFAGANLTIEVGNHSSELLPGPGGQEILDTRRNAHKVLFIFTPFSRKSVVPPPDEIKSAVGGRRSGASRCRSAREFQHVRPI